jgi:hypothetical protein
MTNKPLKQRYRVVGVRTCFPSGTDADNRVYQYVNLKPIPEEGFVLRNAPAGPNIDDILQLCCWQDQDGFTIGQEVYLMVESASE